MPDVGGGRAPASSGSRNSVWVWVTATIAGLSAWFAIYALLLSGLEEHGAQARLYDRLRAELAAETVPVGGPISPGSPVALLSDSAGRLSRVVVVEDTTSQQLVSGPGHLADTPLPGQAGVAVVMGKSVTYGAPFRKITQMRPGDRITAITGQGKFVYTVKDVRRAGSVIPPSLERSAALLTLVTSGSSGWRSAFAPNEAVYVDATLDTGKAQDAPGGRPVQVARAALPMHTSTGSLVPLVLWLEALAVAVATVSWATFRWGRWPTWVVGLPVVLLALWGASGAATQLMPNLI